MPWLLRPRRVAEEKHQQQEFAGDSRTTTDNAHNLSYRSRRHHRRRQHQQLNLNGAEVMVNDLPGRVDHVRDGAAVPRPVQPPQPATVVVNRFGLLELDLSDRDLRDIPDAVFAVGRLEVLRAARNRLRGVPADVAALRCLRVLDVGNNEIVALPDSLANCVRLAELDARGNRLTTLPVRLLAALVQSLRCLLYTSPSPRD